MCVAYVFIDLENALNAEKREGALRRLRAGRAVADCNCSSNSTEPVGTLELRRHDEADAGCKAVGGLSS